MNNAGLSKTSLGFNTLLSILCLISSATGYSDTMPAVKIITTGGTIAHTSEERIDGESLTKAIPKLKDYAEIHVEEYSRIVSTAFETSDMLKLSHRVNRLLEEEPEIDGIVITMGSNAIEEMAYFLNLTVNGDTPVVFTGAQRRHNAIGSDGGKNLLDAVRVAAASEARGMGVLVTVNEEIHAARDVTKTVSYRTDTWDSGDLGNLGLIDSDRIAFYRQSLRRHTTSSEFDVSSLEELPVVPVIYSYIGADGVLVRAAAKEGRAEGIVLAGFPSGAPARPDQHDALEEISRQGIVVVISHRGGNGRIREHYASLASQVEADNLTPQKARVLLMLALTRTKDPKEIQRFFNRY